MGYRRNKWGDAFRDQVPCCAFRYLRVRSFPGLSAFRESGCPTSRPCKGLNRLELDCPFHPILGPAVPSHLSESAQSVAPRTFPTARESPVRRQLPGEDQTSHCYRPEFVFE